MRAQYGTKEHLHLPGDLGPGGGWWRLETEIPAGLGRENLSTSQKLHQENSSAGPFLLDQSG